MGGTPDTISKAGLKKHTNVLLNVNFAQLRDYFACFKSICDNFSIDLEEFEHIFGKGESAFAVWDTDSNGLIDSLELFSGIAVFSDCKLEDKIRFLFDLFDFNEAQQLEPVELQFLIHCVLTATYKIFSLDSEICGQQVETFANDLFPDATKITVADLIKKSRQNKTLKSFFEAIKSQNSIPNYAKDDIQKWTQKFQA